MIYRAAKAGTHFEQGWPNSAYATSKVGVSALTVIQQRAFDADVSRPDIVINSVHPGYVDTDMTSHKGPLTIHEGKLSFNQTACIP
jgi:carbonyl reductase 1